MKRAPATDSMQFDAALSSANGLKDFTALEKNQRARNWPRTPLSDSNVGGWENGHSRRAATEELEKTAPDHQAKLRQNFPGKANRPPGFKATAAYIRPENSELEQLGSQNPGPEARHPTGSMRCCSGKIEGAADASKPPGWPG